MSEEHFNSVVMEDKKAILIPGGVYHVYNRANGSEQVFLNKGNYAFFLEKYQKYITPFTETFCYCLMPNHFHFLIRIKDVKEVDEVIDLSNSRSIQGFKKLEGIEKQAQRSAYLSRQFSHLFNSYVQAFNKQHGRKGSLLMHPYKRKRVNDINYLRNLIVYIHRNPVEAHLVNNLHDWKFSSYRAFTSNEPFTVRKEAVIEAFGGESNFINCHESYPSRVWNP